MTPFATNPVVHHELRYVEITDIDEGTACGLPLGAEVALWQPKT